ncbi:MAG: SWIM zinc finger family protein [Proteobacteria bacterium]|nr:SWIM zinc finger family protein [Pseudomonadota bacterium]MBU1688286.1 SWIM zinc finger family protein [Pseudomonadota bacterium]
MAKSKLGKKTKKEPFTDLTWDDLRQWAGVKILNRGKSYIKNVSGLSCTEDGEWMAWVSGSEEYATSVEEDGVGEIAWFCTCPFDWGPCKHAVAVILAGIEQRKAGKEIPVLDEDSELFLTLMGEDDDYDFDDEDDVDEQEQLATAEVPTGKVKETALEKILRKKSKQELFDLLMDASALHPEVKRRILDDAQLTSGKVDKLISALRREIKNVTNEDAWYNPWRDEGNLPDYSHIQEQLVALLKNGHADEVVELGRELWERGNEQIEQSNDEGETAGEIQQCMEVVFKAVSASSLPPSDQLLWLLDILLEDQFSLSESCERLIRRREYSQVHWRDVAEKLRQRLATMAKPQGNSFSDRYQRERLVDRLAESLARSGQEEKIIPLFEKEVHVTQGYQKLVEAHLKKGQFDQARSWCITGFTATLKDAPGIAHGLRDKLRELAAQEKKFDLVASYRAEDFFDRPGRAGYSELQKAAEKIKLWPEVRAAILRFLETGQRPASSAQGAEKQTWPLPAPEVIGSSDRHFRDRYPDLNTLIDIAILEKRLDDVVQLYQEQQKGVRYGIGMGEEVAAVVAATHPDTALAIWKRIAVGKINLVKPAAYEEAAVYLRKMEAVYRKTKRTDEWRELITFLRTTHKAKRRLMEVLDSLESKRIID